MGAGTSMFVAYFFKKTRIFHTYSTVPASGASRRDPPRHGDLDKFSSKKALCSLSSSKINDLYKESSFSTVCRRATASGVPRREPPRHGVYGKKKIIKQDLQKP